MAGFVREHSVYPGLDPPRSQLRDVAVAVEEVNLHSVIPQDPYDLPVPRDHELLEVADGDEGPPAVAHVLPPAAEVHLDVSQGPPDDLDPEIGQGVHHLLDPLGIPVEGDGDALDAHPVPEPAVEAPHVDTEGIISFLVALGDLLPVQGEAAGGVRVEERPEPLPVLPVLQGVADVVGW